jgi:radical SAM superfamily enzyme YgiQ (UPF0313 family)
MRALLVDNVLLERTPRGFRVDLQPHLGLISLIATLRGAGHQAELYDPKVQLARGELRLGPAMYASAAEQILSRDPEIVGFTALGCNFISTLKIAAAVRRSRPNIPMLLGGPHASLVDREILERHREFDVIVRGEAESTIETLFTALGGAASLAAVDGVSYRENGRVARTRDVTPILDLDALAPAAYDAFPIAELNLRSLDVEAGRGCPFSCTFCSTASFFGRRYRIKSAVRMVADLDELAAKYGIRHFALTHDLFTVNKHSVRDFCDAIADRGYTWNCSARMDCVDDALLAKMRDAGCTAIYYGVETGSPRLQREVDKRLDLALYHPTVSVSLGLGLKPTVSFITGFPAETADDAAQTLELIRDSIERYPPDVTIQLHLLTPEPGTVLHARHADSLAFDGHLADFNVPLLEPDDAKIIAGEPDIFACHHYYDVGRNRADDIAITEAFRQTVPLGRHLLAAFTRRDGGAFGDLLRDFARLRAHAADDGTALVAFAQLRFGADDPYVDITRYIVAVGQLSAGPAAPDPGPPPGTLWLTRRAVPIADCRDGQLLYGRLVRGSDLAATELARSPRLLLVPAGGTAHSMFEIDAVTFALAVQLRAGTTRALLDARFGSAAVAPRIKVLELLDAVISAPDQACYARAGSAGTAGRFFDWNVRVRLIGRVMDDGLILFEPVCPINRLRRAVL